MPNNLFFAWLTTWPAFLILTAESAFDAALIPYYRWSVFGPLAVIFLSIAVWGFIVRWRENRA